MSLVEILEDYYIYFIIIGCNMLLGVFMLEWAWSKVKPLRRVDEERDG
jgi:hypothetical protein